VILRNRIKALEHQLKQAGIKPRKTIYNPKPEDKSEMTVKQAVELLNNFRTCLYPGKFADKNCEGCLFHKACAFEGKGNYKKYKF
jgi:hypothetical protein